MNILKTSIAGLAIAAAVSLPLVGTTAAFAGDATFPPTAVADNYASEMDAVLTIDAASGLLANDSDGGNAGLMVEGVTLSSGGTLSAAADGSFVFTPDSGFTGTAHFIYHDVASGFQSNSADVFIDVTYTPKQLIGAPDFYTTPMDTPLATTGGIGAFHAGVEYGWWEGLTTCATTMSQGDGQSMLDSIMQAKLVRCDVAPFTLFGISLAGFNAIFSLGGALLTILLVRKWSQA